ncbi:MAG: zinc ribbon domain-containing protein, partial [Candidatus Hermodarchaeia archaeon]
LNIEIVLSLYGVSLGIAEPFLLSLFVQIPVAMVAPLIPLFSVAFYAGARGAYREKQHQKYMRSQDKLQAPPSRYIPLTEPTHKEEAPCQHCGKSLDPANAFCTQCGKLVKTKETPL